MDVWELCENAPEYADDIADLYHWSTNYEAGRNPFSLFSLFLDLIGWSQDELGERIYTGDPSEVLGYLEMGKLAAALTQYSLRPSDCHGFVCQLMEAEAEG